MLTKALIIHLSEAPNARVGPGLVVVIVSGGWEMRESFFCLCYVTFYFFLASICTLLKGVDPLTRVPWTRGYFSSLFYQSSIHQRFFDQSNFWPGAQFL